MLEMSTLSDLPGSGIFILPPLLVGELKLALSQWVLFLLEDSVKPIGNSPKVIKVEEGVMVLPLVIMSRLGLLLGLGMRGVLLGMLTLCDGLPCPSLLIQAYFLFLGQRIL